MSMRIRPYTPEDEDATVAVWSIAARAAHPFLADEGTGERERLVREVYLVHAETWVGEDETGAVIGLLGLINHETGPCEVGGLFVHPDAQGNSYGRELMDHARGLKGPLVLDVFEHNGNARAFYEHLGFELSGARIDEMSGQTLCRMEMGVPE